MGVSSGDNDDDDDGSAYYRMLIYGKDYEAWKYSVLFYKDEMWYGSIL